MHPDLSQQWVRMACPVGPLAAFVWGGVLGPKWACAASISTQVAQHHRHGGRGPEPAYCRGILDHSDPWPE